MVKIVGEHKTYVYNEDRGLLRETETATDIEDIVSDGECNECSCAYGPVLIPHVVVNNAEIDVTDLAITILSGRVVLFDSVYVEEFRYFLRDIYELDCVKYVKKSPVAPRATADLVLYLSDGDIVLEKHTPITCYYTIVSNRVSTSAKSVIFVTSVIISGAILCDLSTDARHPLNSASTGASTIAKL